MAGNDIVLGAALRTNLLSLQNTQRSIDSTQLRLATGKKVNSALDNPQNFFTAQSLNNRASDLTRLLDGIGQSIQTINEADKGVTALTRLVEQQSAIVQSARDELLASEGTARVVGSAVDLTSSTTIIGGSIAANDSFFIRTINDSGIQVQEQITIAAGETAGSLAQKITDQFKDNQNGEISASFVNGNIRIESTNGRTFRIQDNTTVANQLTLAGFQALGFTQFTNEQDGASANNVAGTTIVAGRKLTSVSIFEATGNVAEAGDVIVGGTFSNAAGTSILNGVVGSTFSFAVNNNAATTATITLTATSTIQNIVDTINTNTAVNGLIKASYDNSTGQFSVEAISGAANSVEVRAGTQAGTLFNVGLGDPSGNLEPIVATGAFVKDRQYQFNTSTTTLENLAKDYNVVRDQIDDLVKDANYRGVNLLAGDQLVTAFNEDRTSLLTTTGQNFTSDGLGITKTTFGSITDIDLADSQVRAALTNVRAFGSSLANSLSIIQTRQDFTNETVNTLKAGAAQLTDADPNEEGANLLALQTRQQLGVTSLSLASQSQQSVLRLF